MITAGHTLQLIVLVLLGLGVVMVNSAAMSVGGDPLLLQDLLTSRPLIYAALAFGVMSIASHLDIRMFSGPARWTHPLLWLTILTLGLAAAVLIPGVGRSVNGASRWLFLGPRSLGLSFQPSELVKWTSVLAMAWWASREGEPLRQFWRGLVPGLGILGLLVGTVIIEDLGTGVLIGTVGVLLLVAGGAKLWQMVLLAPAGLAAVVGLILTSPYRMRRLAAFLDPYADPQGVGYHLFQSLTAIAGGGLFGRGLGNGLQKFGYLPEDTTDFLFAIICEELGLAGAVFVIALYVVFVWISLGIVRRCREPFGRLLGLGILLTVSLQAMLNIAVVCGVVPTKGIALPFLSSGGTGWVVTAGAVGLLAAIDRLTLLQEAEEAEEAGEASQEPDLADLEATYA